MPLNLELWAGNIRDLTGARFYSSRGFTNLGFSLGSSPNDISAEMFEELAEWVSGPLLVAEIHHQSNELESSWLEDLQVDKILINEAQIANLSGSGLEFVIAIDVGTNLNDVQDKISLFSSYANEFLLTNLNLKECDLSALKVMCHNHDIILDFRIDGDVSILKELELKGIRIEAVPEEQTGIMDFSQVATVLDKIQY